MAGVPPAEGCHGPAIQPPAVQGAGDTSAAPAVEPPAVPGAGDTSSGAPAVEQPPAVPGSDIPAADPTVQPPAAPVPSDGPTHIFRPERPGHINPVHSIPDGPKGPGGRP